MPGMDSVFLVLALERLVGFLGMAPSNTQHDKFDIIIYDSVSSEETLRIMGGCSKARFSIAHFLSQTHAHPQYFFLFHSLIL